MDVTGLEYQFSCQTTRPLSGISRAQGHVCFLLISVGPMQVAEKEPLLCCHGLVERDFPQALVSKHLPIMELSRDVGGA